jgi:hypothetical protein
MGEGVEEDRASAMQWYGRAAYRGYVKARYNLALMLLAEGDPASDRRAMEQLRAAADEGYAKAYYLLATNYRRGIGVPPDRSRADEYLYLAASAGLAKAQYRLARQADRSAPDGERSYWKWLRRAANQGHAKSQYRLGKLVLSCAPIDRPVALAWLRRAAEAGEQRGAYLLALCYAKGLGVERDRVEAYRWMVIARAAGHERALGQSLRLARKLTADTVASINLDALEFAAKRRRQRSLKRLQVE